MRRGVAARAVNAQEDVFLAIHREYGSQLRSGRVLVRGLSHSCLGRTARIIDQVRCAECALEMCSQYVSEYRRKRVRVWEVS